VGGCCGAGGEWAGFWRGGMVLELLFYVVDVLQECVEGGLLVFLFVFGVLLSAATAFRTPAFRRFP
jgi:hypothetical protein